MTRTRRAAWVLGAVSGLVLPALLSAVYIAPHAVFIDAGSKSAQVTLGNSGESPEEVTVELQYGYWATDSLGNLAIRFVEHPAPNEPSTGDWVRAFPRRVRLEPGDRQTVRLLATPPADLPEGEYWTRLIVTSGGAALPVATADTTVRAGVELKLRLVIPVTYRQGAVHTGVAVRRLDATVSGDSLIAWVGLDRLGNAAFLGTAAFRVIDAAGRSWRDWATPLWLQVPIAQRYAAALGGLPPGDYRLILRLTAERADLEDRWILPAAPVTDTVAFRIP